MRAQLHYDKSNLVGAGADAYASTGSALPDWEVVFRFYCAVHIVEAYLAGKDPPVGPSASHDERRRLMHQLPELKTNKRFMSAYKALYDMAYQVRYDPSFRTGPNDIAKSKSDLAIVRAVLDAWVQRQIAKATDQQE